MIEDEWSALRLPATRHRRNSKQQSRKKISTAAKIPPPKCHSDYDPGNFYSCFYSRYPMIG